MSANHSTTESTLPSSLRRSGRTRTSASKPMSTATGVGTADNLHESGCPAMAMPSVITNHMALTNPAGAMVGQDVRASMAKLLNASASAATPVAECPGATTNNIPVTTHPVAVGKTVETFTPTVAATPTQPVPIAIAATRILPAANTATAPETVAAHAPAALELTPPCAIAPTNGTADPWRPTNFATLPTPDAATMTLPATNAATMTLPAAAATTTTLSAAATTTPTLPEPNAATMTLPTAAAITTLPPTATATTLPVTAAATTTPTLPKPDAATMTLPTAAAIMTLPPTATATTLPVTAAAAAAATTTPTQPEPDAATTAAAATTTLPVAAAAATTTQLATAAAGTGRFVDNAAVCAAFTVSGPAATQLARKLQDVRAVAAARDFYLPLGRNVVSRITWIPAAGSNIVIDRAAGFAYTEARAAHAAEPLLNESPDTPDPSHFYVIGNISTECCFLKCDGNFKPPVVGAKFTRTLMSTTLACALVPPPEEHPFLVEEYNCAKATLEDIIKPEVKADPVDWDGFKFKPVQMTAEHIRIRHRVFRFMSDGDPGTADLPAEYQTATWPVPKSADSELASLVKTHYAHPLSAFDLNGNLIPPSRYNELCGATVLAGLSITHFLFTGKKTVCLDIQYLRVLIPGSGRRPSVKRGAFQMTDPLSNAAGKRRAI